MRFDPTGRVLLTVAAGLCCLPAALAQDDPGAPVARNVPTGIEEISVTGSRVPRLISELATAVSQIDQVQLGTQLNLSTNILESLDTLVPGITASQEEARMGCRTNIRGRPAQFLINGVPTNDNLRRSNCGSLYSVSPFALERVEVLRGATALFGAGAPGGAINLITRAAQSEELELDLVAQWSLNPHKASDSGEYNVYVGGGQKLGGWDYYLGAGLQDYGVRRNPDDGIIQGKTFDSNSFNGSLGIQTSTNGSLRFTALHYLEAPEDFYGTDFTQVAGETLATSAFIAEPRNPYEDEAETEQSIITAAYSHGDFLGQRLDVSVYWHDEQLIQRASEFFQGSVFYNNTDAENERLGMRSSLNYVAPAGNGTLDITYGLDWLEQRYYRPQVDPAAGGAVVGYIAPEVMLESIAGFVQPQFRLGNWLFTGGVRHEEFEGEVGTEGYNAAIRNSSTPGDTPDFDLTLFNIGVVYDIHDDLQVYASFSQGAEISEFGRAARGVKNPSTINLEAASSDQYEVGLRGRTGAIAFTAAAFYSESDKAASLQADASCSGQPLCPLIPLRLAQEIHGAELTADWQVLDTTRLGTVVTYQDGEFQAPGADAIPFGTDTVTPLRTTAYIQFAPLPGWNNRLQANYSPSWDIYSAREKAAGYRDPDSVFLVDFSSSYAIGAGTLSLGISNLLNDEYVNLTNQGSGDFFYYLSEGTRVTLGYNHSF